MTAIVGTTLSLVTIQSNQLIGSFTTVSRNLVARHKFYNQALTEYTNLPADTSPKVQHFLWKCMSGCLPVGYNLTHKYLSKDSTCLRCQAGVETENHLLFECTYARLVWALSCIPIPPEGEVS